MSRINYIRTTILSLRSNTQNESVGVGSGNLLASLILNTFLFTGFLSTTIFAQDSLHQTITMKEQGEIPHSNTPSKPNVKLSAISAFYIWNNTPIKTMSIQATGRWEELSILVEPVIVSEPYGPDLLGVDYTRSGISGRITNAFICYENDLLTFQLGRAPVQWGAIISSTSPLQFISNRIPDTPHHSPSPSYDHFDMQFKFGQFHLEILSGQLGSEKLNGNRIKRNIGGHRLVWLSQDNKLFFSF